MTTIDKAIQVSVISYSRVCKDAERLTEATAECRVADVERILPGVMVARLS